MSKRLCEDTSDLCKKRKGIRTISLTNYGHKFCKKIVSKKKMV